jgi:mRNA interferase HigB
MIVISYGTLRNFFEKNTDSKDGLNNWCRIVLKADWSNNHEIKAMFNSVDAVGNDRFVFNIRCNNYRLVAMIFFDIRTVYVRFAGTHNEYDKIDCSAI